MAFESTPQPSSYDLGIQSPYQGFQQGTAFELARQGQQAEIQGRQAQNEGVGIQNQQRRLDLHRAQAEDAVKLQAQARQRAYIEAIQGLGAAPTAQQYLELNSQYPDFAKSTADIASQWGAERTRNETLAGVQYLRVLDADPAKAAQLAADRAKASANAGDQMMQQYWQAHADEAQRLSEVTDPEQRRQAADVLRNHTLLQIAAVNPKGFEDIAKGLKAPGEIAESAAKPLKIGEEIETAKLERKVKLLDVQIRQANTETDRGKLQLDRDKLQAEIDQKKQAGAQDAQSQLDTSSQALSTVNSLISHPGLVAATGTGGDLAAYFRSTGAADFRSMVDTLKSQQFLAAAQAMKGQGALSDAEGARLERAIANIDPEKQSPEAFRNSLGVIKATLEKAQQKVIAGGKVPLAGGAFVMSHPKFGTVTEGMVNSLMARRPGTTRAQVMQYLQSTGGALPLLEQPTVPVAPSAPAAAAPIASGLILGTD